MKPLNLYLGCAQSSVIGTLQMSLQTGEFLDFKTQQLPGLEQMAYAMPMALSPDRQTLYVVSRGVPFFIAVFNVKENGQLQYSGRTEIKHNLACLRVTGDGKHLLGASYDDHCISVYSITKQGLVSNDQPVYPTDKNAHMFVMSPNRTGVFSTSLGGDCLYFWPTLSQLAEERSTEQAQKIYFPSGTGPRHITFHPTLSLAYVIGELAGTISIIEYQNNRLKLVSTVQFPNVSGKAHAADIHITPNGRYLFASDRVHSELFSYRVSDSGELDFIDAIKTLDYPRSFVVTDDSQWLIVAGENSKSIASYLISIETGKLSLSNTFALGHSADWVEC